MEKTRRRGYAVDDEEFEEGLRCIAVPLLDAEAAGGSRKHLRALISRHSPKAAVDRRPTAQVRAGHFCGHGLHVDWAWPDGALGINQGPDFKPLPGPNLAPTGCTRAFATSRSADSRK